MIPARLQLRYVWARRPRANAFWANAACLGMGVRRFIYLTFPLFWRVQDSVLQHGLRQGQAASSLHNWLSGLLVTPEKRGSPTKHRGQNYTPKTQSGCISSYLSRFFSAQPFTAQYRKSYRGADGAPPNSRPRASQAYDIDSHETSDLTVCSFHPLYPTRLANAQRQRAPPPPPSLLFA